MLTSIGKEFNTLNATNAAQAWKMYQRRLMENFGVLCEIMTPKDITELSMKIDEKMKFTPSGGAGSPIDEVRIFLEGAELGLKIAKVKGVH